MPLILGIDVDMAVVDAVKTEMFRHWEGHEIPFFSVLSPCKLRLNGNAVPYPVKGSVAYLLWCSHNYLKVLCVLCTAAVLHFRFYAFLFSLCK